MVFQMRFVKKKQKSLLILSVALFMILGITLGYAVLSSSIKINGTGTISTNWDILFTNIAEKDSKGAINNDSRITDKLTAIFDVDLESPGSYISYNVTVRNNGNTDAVITKVKGIVEANSKDPTGIQFKVSGIRIGDDLLAGSEITFVVRAEIPTGETKLPETSKTLELNLEVRQKVVDSSGLVTTLEECFQTNNTGETITKFLCRWGNSNGYIETGDLVIPGSINGVTITKIADQAFTNSGITSVIFPDTITTIGGQAFYLNQLKKVVIPTSVTMIGESAFGSNRITELVLPTTITSLGGGAFRNNQLPIDQAFVYNRNSDGSENKTSLNSYAGSNRDEIVIPDTVTTIDRNAFYAVTCRSLILPSKLERIKQNGIYGINVEQLVIPETVIELGINSVAASAKLKHVEFKGNVPQTLGYNIFGGNNRDLKIKVPAGTLEQYKNMKDGHYKWFGTSTTLSLDAFYE